VNRKKETEAEVAKCRQQQKHSNSSEQIAQQSIKSTTKSFF